MGLRTFQIHYELERKQRLRASNHDEYVSDNIILPLWHLVLVERQGTAGIDQKLKSAQRVIVARGAQHDI